MTSLESSPQKVAFGSDIHGQFDLYKRLEDKAFAQEGADILVLNGDLINNGTHSLAFLRYLKNAIEKQVKRQEIKINLGNHDVTLLAAWREQDTQRRGYWHDKNKVLSRGQNIFKDIDPIERRELLDMLAGAALYYWDGERFAVHAGIIANIKRTTYLLDRFKKRAKDGVFYDVPRSLTDASLARDVAACQDDIDLYVTGHSHKKSSSEPVLSVNGKRARIARIHGELDLLVHERGETPVIHTIEHAYR